MHSGPYSPRQFPTPPYHQGVIEQIYQFMQQNGCDDVSIVTHSNGANVIRWGFSATWLYDGSQCKMANGACDPGCGRLKDHQLAVINATSTVLALHAPHLGGEAANVVKSISGAWYGSPCWSGWRRTICRPTS